MFYHISSSSSYNERSEKVVEKIKTHIFCSYIYIFEKLAFYEILWENVVESDMPQMAKQRMRSEFWIFKAKNTRSEFEILIAFQRQ